jgi:7,8-dihydropterin-6-yl-methyl-4-(beta-D-ribofuranosyl)aminobenzene 5'-phosphate synthase
MYRGFTLLGIMLCYVAAISAVDAGDLTITILYDDNPFNGELMASHGFSCLVEGTERTILFDTGGSGNILLRNMEKLNIIPKMVDMTVISCTFLGHDQGVHEFLRENNKVTVYILKQFPESIRNTVKNAQAEYVDVQEPMEVCESVYSTGNLGSEQALLIKTSEGLVMIVACAIPGVVGMVRKSKEIFSEEDVYLVIGGFHLAWDGAERIKDIIGEFRKENVKKVAPIHCSGSLARTLFEEEYGDDFILAGVGKEIIIENAFPEDLVRGVEPNSGKAATTWAQIKAGSR